MLPSLSEDICVRDSPKSVAKVKRSRLTKGPPDRGPADLEPRGVGLLADALLRERTAIFDRRAGTGQPRLRTASAMAENGMRSLCGPRVVRRVEAHAR